MSTILDELAEGRDDNQGQVPQITFSDSTVDSKQKSIAEMVYAGRKALRQDNGMEILKKKLVPHLHSLSIQASSKEFDPNDDVQCVVLDNWIEEVLRFLALKTILCDTTEPCQLFSGYAVGVGWKALMVVPSIYSRVCDSMGNSHVFDHDPTDTSSNRVQHKHRVKRFNATLRAYLAHFDQQPPSLYWNFDKRVQKVEDYSFFGMIREILCVNHDNICESACPSNASRGNKSMVNNNSAASRSPMAL